MGEFQSEDPSNCEDPMFGDPLLTLDISDLNISWLSEERVARMSRGSMSIMKGQ